MNKETEDQPLANNPTLVSLTEALGNEPLTAGAIVQFLLTQNPDYGAGLVANLKLSGDMGWQKRPLDVWLAETAVLVDAGLVHEIDGRLIILCLALLLPELADRLQPDGFIQNLQLELERPFETLLSDGGRELARDLPWIVDDSMVNIIAEPIGDEEFVVDTGSAAEEYLTGSELDGFFGDDEISFGGDVDYYADEDAVAAGEGVAEEAAGGESPSDFDDMFSEFEDDGLDPSAPSVMPGEGSASKGAAPEEEQELAKAGSDPLKQARRLEAAMPESVQVDQTTELLVMVPRSSGPGLRAELPLETVGGEIIDQDDVSERETQIEFPAPDIPRVVYLYVQASKNDFEVEDPFRGILLFPDRDGDYETFYLTPLRASDRAPVTVRLYEDEQRTRSLSSVRLATAITVDEEERLHVRFREDVAFAAAAGPVTINYSFVGGDSIHAEISDSEGVAVGGGGAASVAHEKGDSGIHIARLFTPLLTLVAVEAKGELQVAVIGHVQALQEAIELGDATKDENIAGLIENIVDAVPAARTAVATLFENALLATTAGPVTRFVLGRLATET